MDLPAKTLTYQMFANFLRQAGYVLTEEQARREYQRYLREAGLDRWDDDGGR